MKKYLAFDGINGEYAAFETIEEARVYLEERFYCSDLGYNPDLNLCKIFELKETVSYDVIDKKSNYKYMYEEEIPDDDLVSEPWPYNTDFDEIWQHKFIPVI
jgi:hypothetical protein